MDEEELLYKAQRLRKQILAKSKQNSEKMFIAFCVVLMNSVKPDYDEFIKDLELTEDEKLEILRGMLEKRVKQFWSDLENIVEFGENILIEFEKVEE
jgi:hypothetical protein